MKRIKRLPTEPFLLLIFLFHSILFSNEPTNLNPPLPTLDINPFVHQSRQDIPLSKGTIDQKLAGDSLVTLHLSGGSRLFGRVLSKNDSSITFWMNVGIEIDIPYDKIIALEQYRLTERRDSWRTTDPNYTRLMFAPTGRPLLKGSGYFSNYYVFFPGVAYGFNQYFSLMAGFSILPGIPFGSQLKYIAPRINFYNSKNVAFATGLLYTSFAKEYAAGVAFTVGTFGEARKSFTIGFGLGYTKDDTGVFQFAQHPILVLGGNIKISRNKALVTENWFISGENIKLSEQPFALAIRLMNEHLSGDVGVVLIGEVLKHGFPIPWLSFMYQFN